MPAPNEGNLKGPGRSVSRYLSQITPQRGPPSDCLGLSHLKFCAGGVPRVSSPRERLRCRRLRIKHSRCPAGSCRRVGGRQCLWPRRADGEGREVGAPPSAQRASDRVILPFACFLGWDGVGGRVICLCLFLFLFLRRRLDPAFPLIAHRTAWLQMRPWLVVAPPPTPCPSSNHTQCGAAPTLKFKSRGKWQWLGWTVARESLGLGAQAPSVGLQLGSSTGGQFCSPAALRRVRSSPARRNC